MKRLFYWLFDRDLGFMIGNVIVIYSAGPKIMEPLVKITGRELLALVGLALLVDYVLQWFRRAKDAIG